MWNLNTLSPIDVMAGRRYVLHDNLEAIEIIQSPAGPPYLGPILKIPEGTEIEHCGSGFNEDTLEVRCRGKLYFVFRNALETQLECAAMCACC